MQNHRSVSHGSRGLQENKLCTSPGLPLGPGEALTRQLLYKHADLQNGQHGLPSQGRVLHVARPTCKPPWRGQTVRSKSGAPTCHFQPQHPTPALNSHPCRADKSTGEGAKALAAVHCQTKLAKQNIIYKNKHK